MGAAGAEAAEGARGGGTRRGVRQALMNGRVLGGTGSESIICTWCYNDN